MSWTGGASLADKAWAIVRPHIDPHSRQEVAEAFIDAFEDEDADTMDECTQLQKDLKTDSDDVVDDWILDFDDFDDWEDE